MSAINYAESSYSNTLRTSNSISKHNIVEKELLFRERENASRMLLENKPPPLSENARNNYSNRINGENRFENKIKTPTSYDVDRKRSDNQKPIAPLTEFQMNNNGIRNHSRQTVSVKTNERYDNNRLEKVDQKEYNSNSITPIQFLEKIPTSRTPLTHSPSNRILNTISNAKINETENRAYFRIENDSNQKLLQRIEVGLENLGNTCFMNSALQCLLHVRPLVSYFLQSPNKIERDINKQSPTKGLLAKAFYNLIQDVYNKSSGNVVSPVSLQKTVCKLAPYLMDSQQQDCQEFLRFFLDGLSEDLCRKDLVNSDGISQINPDSNQAMTSNSESLEKLSLNPAFLPAITQSSNNELFSPSSMQVNSAQSPNGSTSFPTPYKSPDNRSNHQQLSPTVPDMTPNYESESYNYDRQQSQSSSYIVSKKPAVSPTSEGTTSNSSARNRIINDLSLSHQINANFDKNIDKTDTEDELEQSFTSQASSKQAWNAQDEQPPAQMKTTSFPPSTNAASRRILRVRRSRNSPLTLSTPSLKENDDDNGGINTADGIDPLMKKGGFSPNLNSAARLRVTTDNQGGSSSSGAGSSRLSAAIQFGANVNISNIDEAGDRIELDNSNDMVTKQSQTSNSQQNSQEYSSVIAKEAFQSWQRYIKLSGSIITDLFAGQLQSTMECLTCHHKSYSFDPFLDISVPINKDGSDVRSRSDSFSTSSSGGAGRTSNYNSSQDAINQGPMKSTLEKCLAKFTAEEILEGDNMYLCEKCGKKCRGSKKLSIYRYPKILVIHIKRFRYSATVREKLSTDVQFPLSGLDLTPYISTDAPIVMSNNSKNNNNNQIEKNNNQNDIEPDKKSRSFHMAMPFNQNRNRGSATDSSFSNLANNSMDVKLPSNSLNSLSGFNSAPPVYDLIAVANHYGSLHGGHYIAHVDTNSSCDVSDTANQSNTSSKTALTNSTNVTDGNPARWVCFNDSKVSLASSSSMHGPSAYVLFYCRKDVNQPIPSNDQVNNTLSNTM